MSIPCAVASSSVWRARYNLVTCDFLDRTDCRGQRVLVARLGIVDWQEVGAVARDAWQVQLYADNLTDTRAELFANYRQYYKAVTVNRPRTVRLRLTYRIR